MSLVGLDIGTTGCKSVAISAGGEVLTVARREYPVLTPRPDWRELDPEEVWQSVKQVLSETAGATAADPVEAISISAMSDTVTAFDQNLRPCYPTILAFDNRSADEARQLGERLGKRWLFETTGMDLHPAHSASKILWIRNHMPSVFARTWKFLCYEDYILARLGAEPVISYSMAARTMLFDQGSNGWHPRILEACGITAAQLPRPQSSGEVAGSISPAVARELGLPEKTLLAVGGHDQTCAALGCGVVEEGTALDTTGTVEVLLVTFTQPRYTPAMLASNICCYPHCYPGRYCSFGQLYTAGAAFRWYRDQFAHPERQEAEKAHREVYDLITARIPSSGKGVFFVPYLSGSATPAMDPRGKGALYGLTLDTDRHDVARAVLEGITFELRINIELLERLFDIEIARLLCVGGGARSDFWLQLKSDISGLPVLAASCADASALGAAVLAGVGSKRFGDFAEGIQAVSGPLKTISPRPETHRHYRKKFQDYVTVRDTISQLFTLGGEDADVCH